MCVHIELQCKTFTTGIWNLPIIRANPIVGVEAEWPSTACVVSDFVQFPSGIKDLVAQSAIRKEVRALVKFTNGKDHGLGKFKFS